MHHQTGYMLLDLQCSQAAEKSVAGFHDGRRCDKRSVDKRSWFRPLQHHHGTDLIAAAARNIGRGLHRHLKISATLAHRCVFGEADAHGLAIRADEQLMTVGSTGKHARQAHLHSDINVLIVRPPEPLELGPMSNAHGNRRICSRYPGAALGSHGTLCSLGIHASV